MNLAGRIKMRMSELKLTQEALANLADMSQGMVYKLVSGKSKSTSKIVQLAKALECDIEWLATGTKNDQSSRVQESTTSYSQANGITMDELKKMIKTLSPKDQKKVALEILDELISKS